MHVDTNLSAYLDGELGPADRGRVEAHLGTCDRCRARLSELRATASLISALPAARPSRSLVPRVDRLGTSYGVDAARQGGWNWLRPMRSFSAFASGAFLFVFLVTAVGRSGSGLGGGTTAPFGPVPQAAPAAVPAPATAPERAALTTPQIAPAPAAGAAATARADTASPALGFATQATDKAAEDSTARARELARTPPPFTDPLIWLGLAVIAAVLAIGAHWRLRST